METEGTDVAAKVADATLWMPPQASTVAEGVDDLYYGIYWICVFFFLLITVMVVYFVAKYRRKSDDQLATSQIAHSTKVEFIWTAVPTVLVIGIFVWGFNVFMDLHVAPVDAMEVKVTAQKWSWSFEYSNGDQTPGELFVPEGKPVKLLMQSRDVIHSFYIPAFRVKQDVVPGRYTTMWFEAKKAGDYQVFCTEYCGTSHSQMLATVKVLPVDEFNEKMEKGFGPNDPVARGEKLYSGYCKACHSVDGSKVVGPTFKGLFGREEKIQGQAAVTVDENYLRESILEPNAKIVEGYPAAMPSFKGQLKDEQIDDIITWMKTIK